MAEPAAENDAALQLDMWLAALDARSFLEGLDRAAFLASRLHQNAVIRSLEVIGEAAGKEEWAAFEREAMPESRDSISDEEEQDWDPSRLPFRVANPQYCAAQERQLATMCQKGA